jgi:protein involved in polysaccharide export with SLBB domain
MRKKYFTLQKTVAMLLSGALLVVPAARAQSNSDGTAAKSAPSMALEDYKIGSGDVLAVSVADAPEFGGKFRVTDTGVIEVPGVSGPIRAEGQSASELAHAIREALIGA